MTPWHAHIPPRHDPSKPRASAIRGKGRPRFTRTGHAYTPDDTRSYEAEIATMCRQARGRDPISEGWVVLGVIIVDLIPTTWRTKSGAPTLQARRAAWQQEPAAARPDCDQVLKIAGDGANKMWFQGDAKVLPVPFRCWTADPRRAGVHLYLWPAATPAEALSVLSGPWLETVKEVMKPPAGWAPPHSSVSSSSSL